MNNEWVCTDNDLSQYCKRIDDFTWAFIEARETVNRNCVACHAVICLQDYTLDELWQYCKAYYDSFEQIINDCGLREGLRIMAECVFEQLYFDEMEFNAERESFSEATKFIEKWIKGLCINENL